MTAPGAFSPVRALLGVIATIGVVVHLSPPVAVQSLADVARTEAARRARVTERSRTVSDKDLKAERAPLPPPPDAVVTGADAPAEGSPVQASPEEKISGAATAPTGAAPAPAREKRDEQYWRARFARTRQAVNNAAEHAAAVQARISTLDRELERDLPPARLAEVRAERTAAAADLGRLQQEVEFLRGDLEAAEHLARQLEVPPDWTR